MAAPALYRRPTLVWGAALPASSSPFSVTNLLRAPVDVCWEKLAAGEAWGLVLASANWAVGVDDGVAGAGGVVFSSVGLVVMVVVVVVVGLVVGLVVDLGTHEGGSSSKKPRCMLQNQAGGCVCVRVYVCFCVACFCLGSGVVGKTSGWTGWIGK